MKKRAIFWDFDGTLVHANKSFLCSLTSAFAQYNYEFEKEILKEFLLKTSTWYLPCQDYVGRTGEMWWDELIYSKLRSFCDQHNVEKNDQEPICKQFRENVINYAYVLYDDTKEVLSYYKEKGFYNYILSNNYPELIEVIKRFGLDTYFTDFFVSSNIGYEKPRIELFRYAIEKANHPDCCYMIGDNPIADMKGGKEAGMHTILVHRKDANEWTDHICENLLDIKQLLY